MNAAAEAAIPEAQEMVINSIKQMTSTMLNRSSLAVIPQLRHILKKLFAPHYLINFYRKLKLLPINMR